MEAEQPAQEQDFMTVRVARRCYVGAHYGREALARAPHGAEVLSRGFCAFLLLFDLSCRQPRLEDQLAGPEGPLSQRWPRCAPMPNVLPLMFLRLSSLLLPLLRSGARGRDARARHAALQGLRHRRV